MSDESQIPGVRMYFKNGAFVFVLTDEEDEPILAAHRWRITSRGYVRTTKRELLHRLLLGLSSDDGPVHHRNNIKTDNRRANLVPCADAFEHASYHRFDLRKGRPSYAAKVEFMGALVNRFASVLVDSSITRALAEKA